MERVRGRWDGVVYVGRERALTLSDMDEALFRLTGLLDYRVTVSKGKDGRFRLHIDVHRAEGGNPTEREVLQALGEVEAIRRGMGAPSVRFSADGRWTTTGVSKRKIVVVNDPAP